MTTPCTSWSMPRSRRALLLPVLAVAVLGACGGDAAETAKGLIEGELEEQIGLGELTATCNQPDKLEQGETFECTALTPDGRTLEFAGEMTADDKLNVQTTNLLTATDVEAIVPLIADAVAAEVGAEVAASDITCPEGSIIPDADGDFDCEILDRQTGDRYVITIQTGGLEPGGGPKDLGFLIGDPVDS